MAWHWPDDKPSSEPMMVSLLRHICVTLPQWVNWGKVTQCLLMTWCLISPTKKFKNLFRLKRKKPSKFCIACKGNLQWPDGFPSIKVVMWNVCRTRHFRRLNQSLRTSTPRVQTKIPFWFRLIILWVDDGIWVEASSKLGIYFKLKSRQVATPNTYCEFQLPASHRRQFLTPDFLLLLVMNWVYRLWYLL